MQGVGRLGIGQRAARGGAVVGGDAGGDCRVFKGRGAVVGSD